MSSRSSISAKELRLGGSARDEDVARDEVVLKLEELSALPLFERDGAPRSRAAEQRAPDS